MSALPMTLEDQDAIWKELFQNLMEFTFPSYLTWSHAAGARLFAWARNGPAIRNNTTEIFNRSLADKALMQQTSAAKGLKTTAMRDLPEGALTFFGAGGYSGNGRPMLAHELKLVLNAIVDQFIFDVYSHEPPGYTPDVATYPPNELANIKRQSSPEVHSALEFTVQEVTDLCLSIRPIKKSSKSPKRSDKDKNQSQANTTGADSASSVVGLSTKAAREKELVEAARALRKGDQRKRERERIYSMFSDAILNERERRLKALRTASIRLDNVRTDKLVTHYKVNVLYNQVVTRPYDVTSYETPMDLQRSLHRNAGNVMLLSYGPAATSDVVQNVKILRPDRAPKKGQAAWDGYCCVRKRDTPYRIM